MNAVDFAEIERKYEVDAASVLPSLQDLPGVTWVDAPVEQSLDAVYFDTADLTLAAHRITLRRRTGGDDAGWHLKLPSGVEGRAPDERPEVHEPLGTDPELVPAGLQQRVRIYVRDRVLVPIVRLRNHRIVHVLRGDNGAVLAGTRYVGRGAYDDDASRVGARRSRRRALDDVSRSVSLCGPIGRCIWLAGHRIRFVHRRGDRLECRPN